MFINADNLYYTLGVSYQSGSHEFSAFPINQKTNTGYIVFHVGQFTSRFHFQYSLNDHLSKVHALLSWSWIRGPVLQTILQQCFVCEAELEVEPFKENQLRESNENE